MLRSIRSHLNQGDLEVLARGCRLQAELRDRCGLVELHIVTFISCFRTVCIICRRDRLMIVNCRHGLLIQLMVCLGLKTHLRCCQVVDRHGKSGRRSHLSETGVRLRVSGDVEHIFGLALNDHGRLNAAVTKQLHMLLMILMLYHSITQSGALVSTPFAI